MSNALAAIREEWLASAIRDFDQKKAEELAKLDRLAAVAWAAWERSCQDAETRHQRTEAVRLMPRKRKAIGPARLVPVKRMSEKTTKGQPGDPRFLAQVGWCVETRSKVMGILRDIKNVNQQIVTRLD